MDFKSVLSIQSHVVHGFVGNKAATFPLQVLGFDVDPMNSVQFSNHTGYQHWSGQVMESNHLQVIYDSILKNSFQYSHVLTGYVRSKSFLLKLNEIISEFRKSNPNLVYVCDPVLGDNNKLYVPDELIDVYKDKIINLADILTPNQFEAEILSGIKITNENNAIQAMKVLHSKGIKTVIITSCDFNPETISCYASSSSTNEIYKIQIERIDISLVGSGDLFAALMLAWYTLTNHDLKTSFEKSIGSMQDVIKRTYQYAKQSNDPKDPKNYELQIIQSYDEIKSPKTLISSIKIE